MEVTGGDDDKMPRDAEEGNGNNISDTETDDNDMEASGESDNKNCLELKKKFDNKAFLGQIVRNTSSEFPALQIFPVFPIWLTSWRKKRDFLGKTDPKQTQNLKGP